MRKDTLLNIVVHNPHKGSERKQGTTWTFLHQGQRIAAVQGLYFPNQDRSLQFTLLRALEQEKPDLVLCLGHMIFDEIVQDVAPRALRNADEDDLSPAPEVEAAKAHSDVYEERVLHVMRAAGNNVFRTLLAAAGEQSRIIYIPAAEGTQQSFPPEANIRDILEKRILPRVFAWRESQVKADETRAAEFANVPALPTMRKDFKKLLGLDDEERIEVLRFGSALMVYCTIWVPDDTPLGLPFAEVSTDDNRIHGGDSEDNITDILPEQEEDIEPVIGQVFLDEATGRKFQVTSKVRFIVGKRKLMHPITEAYEKTHLDGVSTYMGFPGSICNGFFTKKLARGLFDRVLFQFGQIGMLFDRRRMNWGDANNERLASGFYFGENLRGTLHGGTSPFMYTRDRRRGIYFWGHVFLERSTQQLSRTRKLPVR